MDTKELDMDDIELLVKKRSDPEKILSAFSLAAEVSAEKCQQHSVYSHSTESVCNPLQTLMHEAIGHKHYDLVTLLSRHVSFNPNCSTFDIPAPLNHACYVKDERLIRLLLDAGANVHLACKFQDWHQTVSSFDIILENDDVAALKLLYPRYELDIDRLLRSKASLIFHRYRRGKRPIHAAVEHKAFKCVEYLLVHQPQDNETEFIVDHVTYTPIDLSVGCSVKMFKLFIQNGVSVPANIVQRLISAVHTFSDARYGGCQNVDFKNNCLKLQHFTRYFVDAGYPECNSESELLSCVLNMAATFNPVHMRMCRADVDVVSNALLQAAEVLLSRNESGRIVTTWSVVLMPHLVATFMDMRFPEDIGVEAAGSRRLSFCRAKLYMDLIRRLLQSGLSHFGAGSDVTARLPPLTFLFRVCFLSADALRPPEVWVMFEELVKMLLLYGLTMGVVDEEGHAHQESMQRLYELRGAGDHTLSVMKRFLTWYLNALPTRHYMNAAKTLRRAFLELGVPDLVDFLAVHRRIPRTLRKCCRAVIVAQLPAMRAPPFVRKLGLPAILVNSLLDLEW